MKILIADDEQVVCNLLDEILKAGGNYETDIAHDGEETLNKIKANLYDLVLLDIEMPKRNGYEILKISRELFPDLPVVFVTGKGTSNKISESIAKYQLTAVIEKPFKPKEVLDIVARSIKLKS